MTAGDAMADRRSHPVLSYLRRVLGAPAAGGVTDAALVRRFVEERDEAAFELLLWRHAAAVLHVCRQVLDDPAAADDAFQATFLVFVRKAGSIGRRESLGGWLYRVAHRIALKARASRNRRPVVPAELDGLAARPDGEDAVGREFRRVVCEEVNRLPAKYRAAVVACFFEGRTHAEAAAQLAWPVGTVAGRLSRARELLRRRLVRRDVALPAGALAAALAPAPSQAALASLIQSTLHTVTIFRTASSAGAAVSPRAAAWAEGVIRAMYWTRVKIGAVIVLAVVLSGAGATLWATQRPAAEPPDRAAPEAGGGPAAAKAEQPEDAEQTARAMAESRLNLRKLAAAMHAYLEKNGHFPAPAIYGKDGKALLSWRVALLPYLEQNNLYKQFHLDEPWDSPHNRPLADIIVKVYAPPGRPVVQPVRTYYQVFVSGTAAVGAPGAGGAGGPGGGAAGPMGGAGGAPPAGSGGSAPAPGGGPKAAAGGATGPPGAGGDWTSAAFVKGRSLGIAHISDGTSNTILIVEAGNAVPWTKPEDLHYAADEPLPELGGLFPDVIHTAFADGTVHTLTKKYDEATLREVITANGGEVYNPDKIEALPRRGAEAPAREGAADGDWQRRNDALRRELERERERLRLLREERTVQREQGARRQKRPADPREEALRRENLRLQEELDKVRAECDALEKEISRLQKPIQRKEP